MAVNETRNLGNELRAGLTDGVVKKVAPDRGGVIDPAAQARNETLQSQYGAVSYGSSYEEDKVASRLHDSKHFGAGDQGTEYTWYKTDELGHEILPSVPGVTP